MARGRTSCLRGMRSIRDIAWCARSAPLSLRLPELSHLGHQVPDWPRLLYLYSRMKPGKTVLEWMEDHQIEQLGIDVRRFTSFGVIKVVWDSWAFRSKKLTSALGFPPPGSQVARSPTRHRIIARVDGT